MFSNDINQSCGSTNLQRSFNMATFVIFLLQTESPISYLLFLMAVIIIAAGATLLLCRFPLNSLQDAHLRAILPHYTNTSFLTSHSILDISFHTVCICGKELENPALSQVIFLLVSISTFSLCYNLNRIFSSNTFNNT